MDGEPVLEADQSERLLVVLSELAPNRVCNAVLAYSITASEVIFLLTRSHPHLRPAQLAIKLNRAVNRATGSRAAHETFSSVIGNEAVWRRKLRAHTINFVLLGNWRDPFDLEGYEQGDNGRAGD